MLDEGQMFPKDTYIPEMFNVETRKYLVDNIGDHPNTIGQKPLHTDVNPRVLRALMDRMFQVQGSDEKRTAVFGRVVDATKKSLEAYKRRQQHKKVFGIGNMMDDLGVSNKLGHNKGFRYFSVALDHKVVASGKGLLTDLLQQHEADEHGVMPDGFAVDTLANEGGDVEAVPQDIPENPLDAFVVKCPWCPELRTGRRALQAIDSHVRGTHPGNGKVWAKAKEGIKIQIADMKAGNV